MTAHSVIAGLCCLMILHIAEGAQASGRRANDQEMGKRFEIRADFLPKPYEGPAVRNTSRI